MRRELAARGSRHTLRPLWVDSGRWPVAGKRTLVRGGRSRDRGSLSDQGATSVTTEDDVRRLCLALPEVHERPHHHVAMFYVGRRHFANTRSVWNSHLADMGADQPIAVMKLDREDQLALVEANPGVLLPHRYFARHGWAVLLLAHADAGLLDTLLHLAWANIAPKRLLKTAQWQDRP
jgi:hypothetical protein